MIGTTECIKRDKKSQINKFFQDEKFQDIETVISSMISSIH